MSVKVKICGIMRNEDIDAVNAAMPDYIGFVFAEGYRRRISPERARGLTERLAPGIKKVGVFVAQDYDTVMRAAEISGTEVVQLCADEPQSLVSRLRAAGLEVWKAVHIGAAGDIEKMKCCEPDRFLFDTKSNVHGGSGRTFDLGLLGGTDLSRHIIAGGLDVQNAAHAAAKHPYCLDVSSGVETAGAKDARKIAAFVRTVRGEA